ncbi:ABC transporter substrate-binding protein [Roseococcus sp. DSY-14]|uniref:ABC transporter substrate-binding protein n=1 Tax=Roseococcus sp. DSY-14 TaxID=3369650 RepID=UPI00387B6F9D
MPLDLPAPNLRPDAPALRLGHLPLMDAAPLLVAEAKGMFRAVGLRVALDPETAWAALRDRLALGALDGAHLLAPLALALAGGAGGVRAELSIGCTLSANGNGIFLSAAALSGGLRPGARFGIVHPFSAHHVLLRRWLERQGLRDATLVAAPPPAMAGLVAAGELDGFCAGAPWPAAAEAAGLGRVVAGTAEVWPDHPEKVLAFRADRRREVALAATAAVLAAGRWLNEDANRAEALALLRDRLFPGMPQVVLASAFDATHRMRFVPGTDRAAAALFLPDLPPMDPSAALAPWDRCLEAQAGARLSTPTESPV